MRNSQPYVWNEKYQAELDEALQVVRSHRPEPDIRSIRVEGIGYEEFRRGTVGYYLLGLVEANLGRS